jgi:DNA-binding MarR family transcriptional regulator
MFNSSFGCDNVSLMVLAEGAFHQQHAAGQMMTRYSVPAIDEGALASATDSPIFPAEIGEREMVPNVAAPQLVSPKGIGVLYGTLLTLVRRDGRDLTARQLTAYLAVYQDEAPHTVSSLADLLRVTRPGVTRIIDRLVEFDLVSREEDSADRRRVRVSRTGRGVAFFRDLSAIANDAARPQTG